MKISKKQKGFTIIELVVVILLLGILTATALPRFMDVTDDAHTAVVSSVVGGIGTGSALFRAQWMAKNQPQTNIVAFNGLLPNSQGYAVGTGTYNSTNVSSVETSVNCAEVFTNLMQSVGQPSIQAKTGATTDYSAVTSLPTGTDFVSYIDTDADDVCYYFYTGQYTNVTNNLIPVIRYNALTGAVGTVTGR